MSESNGLITGTGLVATLRKGEGQFGDAVAVEEGTTNLVTNPPTTFQHKAAVSGTDYDEYTISVSASTEYTLSVYVESWSGSGNAVQVTDNATTPLSETIAGEEGRLTSTFTTGSDATTLTVRIGVVSTATAQMSYRYPQVEEKAFATSFVDGTRAHGDLSYTFAESTWDAPFTVAGWVRFYNASPDNDYIFSCLDKWALRALDGGMMEVRVEDSTSTIHRSPLTDPGVALTDRNHFAIAYDTSTFDVYVNGSLLFSWAYSDPLSGFYDGLLHVGAFDSASHLLNGLVDEIVIAPHAASEDEISRLANATLPIAHKGALLGTTEGVRLAMNGSYLVIPGSQVYEAPAKPTGVTFSEGRISWDDQDDAASFEVYRNDKGGTNTARTTSLGTVNYPTRELTTDPLGDDEHISIIVVPTDDYTGEGPASDPIYLAGSNRIL